MCLAEESLQEHLHLGEDHFCRDDSSVESDLLQRARAELQQELGAKTDVDMKEELQVPLLLNIYNTYSEYLTRCPQAVLQATAAKLEGLLQHLRSSCGSQELVHVCRATTPFMFDVFIYYLLLKHFGCCGMRYGLVDLYSSNGNVTANYIFRGWPIEQQERRIWFLFGALWRVIWPERDYCACVEAYDYYTTMHSLFENSLHIGRGDLHRRLLRKGTEIRRMVEAAEHCEEWLEKDFQRIFSSYAKHSACLPGALMENIVCLQRWLLAGKVVGSLNTAEMMVKLLTLSDTCLDDTHWPFTKADVQYNFARLVSNWREGNIGCQAMNRLGERLEESGCPEQLSDAALGHLLWKPSPFQQSGAQVQCTIDLPEACILDGVITVRSSSGLPENLQTCSETGRNRHQLKHSATLGQWLDAELDKQTVGFVLNLPESGDNVWHNLHWIVPATARLYGKAKTSLGVRAPRDVLLILLFDAYEFREDDQQANLTEETAELHQALQKQHFEQWVVRHAPLLQLLTSSPPVLLHTLRRRCFQLLLWGHSEMRADRELRHNTALGPDDVKTFQTALTQLHGQEMDAMAAKFWNGATSSRFPKPRGAVSVLIIQRAFAHGRAFLAWPNLTKAVLSPLAQEGHIAWRTLDDLEQRPLLQQAAFFRSADVLVGAVGAALGWMLLMLPGSQVLEWIPRGVQPCLYRCSEEWNADHLGMFGGLGRLSGVDHVCLRSEAHPLQLSDAKRFSATRATARDAYWRLENLQVDLHKFSRWVTEGVRRAAEIMLLWEDGLRGLLAEHSSMNHVIQFWRKFFLLHSQLRVVGKQELTLRVHEP
ncbi:unnamed protein product [Durusdinium trenchii]|uniref:Uncharacterized protein n=1 Tax=Durusdinium trenchii TaxID=1381693 RepID=A0ABP0JNI3_9DINO